MKSKSIVCFANDWHNDPTSKHQVMKILAIENKILWINSVGLRTPAFNKSDMARILQKTKGLFKGIEKVNNNLYVMSPLVIPFHKYNVIKKINNYILAQQIKYYLNKLRMKDVQIWTFMPTMLDMVAKLKYTKMIYYCVDDWSKFSFVDRRLVTQMETDLVKKVDIVIASAKELYEQKRRHNSNTHLVHHGVDYKHFSKSMRDDCLVPADVKDIKKPIIGFFGLIHEWIDLSLIKGIAESRPEWAIVMIGKVSIDVTDLSELPNVHFLGQKDYKDLPGYCKAFDVAVIPFKINELTMSVNPIKLREYMAAGLPVLSTALPEVMKYRDMVNICDSIDNAVVKIESILSSENTEKRIHRSKKMAEETWENKVIDILKILEVEE